MAGYSKRLARSYMEHDLVDCCAGRRPKGRGAVTYLGRSGFHLWGLSANQNCRAHVCPVRVETEPVEVCSDTTSTVVADS